MSQSTDEEVSAAEHNKQQANKNTIINYNTMAIWRTTLT